MEIDNKIKRKQFPNQKDNPGGVAKLVEDIRENIRMFQAETGLEVENIVWGLKQTIKDMEPWAKEWKKDDTKK